ncbi:MAG: nucleoside hydrolase, partial [Bacteroidota bacterium]|nr:nucleoside hydrolase [Bacteroidota bacterium]
MKRLISMSLLLTFVLSVAFCVESETISIAPLNQAVLVNEPVAFRAIGGSVESTRLVWDLGDGTEAEGPLVTHSFHETGVYTISLYSILESLRVKLSTMIIRVHTSETIHIPQIFLDTDARNEADDQHYIAYCLYSDLDIIGINSVHNGGPGSEQINYGEIFNVMKLMNWSGSDWDSLPLERVYHGAGKKLDLPESGQWYDTEPIVTEASHAILAAARGANPDNPVWIMPVGPCTNIASAVLQARNENFDLKDRIRVYWLGGREKQFNNEYNGGNDPWSVFVMGKSGLDFQVMLAHPTSLKLHIDNRVESHLYPENDLGDYLETITPVYQWRSTEPKSIHDVCVPAAIKSNYLGLNWVTRVVPAQVSGPENNYRWEEADSTSAVRLVWDINGEAMKKDLFHVLNKNPDSDQDEENVAYKFNKLFEENWREVFNDPCTVDWRDNWVLDGTRATIENSPQGMTFSAGEIPGNDTCHAVLWTKESMKGDVWIEYEYTRIDSQMANVNILYIQATGESPYATEILEWSDARKVPAMRTYYDHMNTLHLSYAAFNKGNIDSEADYIRARRYMPALNNGLRGTEIGQSY